MKSFSTVFTFLIGALLFSSTLNAQITPSSEDSGLPGDHFSLEGALDLFKNAASPEAFEAALNAKNNTINNLDLNEDGAIDYIRVEDHWEGEVHAIVLQVPVSEEEGQDIAVIEIEKQGKDNAILQIIGDEDIYGEPLIVEPYEETAVPGGKGGPAAEISTMRVVVNVWLWPSVRYVYRPAYRVYVSPFHWGRYPSYWTPWRPRPWKAFRSSIVNRPHCRVVTTHRVVRAHRVYTPRRTHSVVVHKRTTTRLAARPKTVTKSTSTKVGAKRVNGKTVVGKKKTTTVTAKNKKGQTVTKKKTTAVGAKKGKGKTVVGKKKTTKVAAKNGRGKAAAGKKTTKKVRKR